MKKRLKKLILGVIIGAIALLLFIFFGGAKYVRIFGVETEKAGRKLEKIEKKVRKGAEAAKEKVGYAAEEVRDTVDKASSKVKGYVDD
jgi:hypothetical protein